MDKYKDQLNSEKILSNMYDSKKTNKTNEIVSTSDITLVNNALEYYDKNIDKYKHKFKDIVYLSLDYKDNDIEQNNIIFYDRNLRVLFTSKFERLGMYDAKTGIWSWAWTIPKYKKNETNIIRKILNYGAELDPSSIYIKTELVTSRFRITNNAQLDLHCALASYLSKKPIIFKYKIYSNVEIIDNKYVNISEQKYSFDSSKEQYELTYYIFLLDNL